MEDELTLAINDPNQPVNLVSYFLICFFVVGFLILKESFGFVYLRFGEEIMFLIVFVLLCFIVGSV